MADLDSAVLAIVEEVVGLLELGDLHRGLLRVLRGALASEWASLNDIGPRPGDVVVLADPPIPAAQVAAFARYSGENPLVRRYTETQDGRAYRFSDVIAAEELERTALYRECYAPLGVRHQIAFTLPATDGRILGLALSRHDPDYTDAERDLINRCRPLLIQVFRNALAFHQLRLRLGADLHATSGRLRAAGLTERQSDVIARMMIGQTPREIAGALGISERTVNKHTQLAYGALGVSTRTAAVERALRLI